ncbi:MAG: UTP--glucose-1-phosphate uridylyltransferase [endosymbiont of Escarpia spicata]|uniref:UTP--glucose-1-phosphate uridylyltransferase n=1 Tax=endosymbiont of Escarpia spicata TaxID=2200908 RepID=A0A370DRK2_9GAMM|nr:MAG: UTP--glucose-1-phosphate uridylyltransferase [Gammaproteobacteria bacterium (ex Lamellibrachia satsuma)]RDH87235.1 MAG: UTP--glucose-1-phosphate uridylyltransferase [endosymbiont of Escarpia spicata]
MQPGQENRPIYDKTILLVLFILFLFASPVVYWWTNPGSPWYLPYLLWLVAILLGALIHIRQHHES